MNRLETLLKNNRDWADRVKAEDPGFFSRLTRQQKPEYLWVGCSDSRVPANQIVDLLPGELFVHRNVANLVVHTDLNCLSVMQYAVDVLQVKHIIVCGHYGCGGVNAALAKSRQGLIDNWLCHISDVHRKHEPLMSRLTDETARGDRLCELNVLEQVTNICQTTILRDAWQRQQEISVHGWVYDIHDGYIRDLRIDIDNHDEFDAVYRQALDRIARRIDRAVDN